jgi:putative Mg2+ transporter-C (MgtC) family protein
VLAVVVTAGHFLIVLGFVPLAARIPGSPRGPAWLRLDYEDGRGVLRAALVACTDMGFSVVDLSAEHDHEPSRRGTVTVHLTVQGPRPIVELASALSELDGMRGVSTTQDDAIE